MLPSDRLVCASVVPQTVGTQFANWWLHVTIVPWFGLQESSEVLAQGLGRALQATSAFEVQAGGTALFGPRGNRPVRLLEQSVPLARVEAKVRGYLHKKRAWLVDETTKRLYAFRPHVTAQGDTMLPADGAFVVNRLYIVEQKGDYKEIVAEVVIGD